jgi:hypothetical protein
MKYKGEDDSKIVILPGADRSIPLEMAAEAAREKLKRKADRNEQRIQRA